MFYDKLPTNFPSNILASSNFTTASPFSQCNIRFEHPTALSYYYLQLSNLLFFSSVSIKNFSVYRLYLCSIFIHIFMQRIAYLSAYIISFPLYNLYVFDLPMLLLLHYYPLPYQFPPLSSFYLYPSLLSLHFFICHYYYCNLNLIILSLSSVRHYTYLWQSTKLR